MSRPLESLICKSAPLLMVVANKPWACKLVFRDAAKADRVVVEPTGTVAVTNWPPTTALKLNGVGTEPTLTSAMVIAALAAPSNSGNVTPLTTMASLGMVKSADEIRAVSIAAGNGMAGPAAP